MLHRRRRSPRSRKVASVGSSRNCKLARNSKCNHNAHGECDHRSVTCAQFCDALLEGRAFFDIVCISIVIFNLRGCIIYGFPVDMLFGLADFQVAAAFGGVVFYSLMSDEFFATALSHGFNADVVVSFCETSFCSASFSAARCLAAS